MNSGLLLDTYAVLRITEDDRIAAEAKQDIDRAAARNDVFVSPISAWEIATLVSKGRVALSMEPQSWFDLMLALPGIRLAPMPPRTLIASAFLPERRQPIRPVGSSWRRRLPKI